MRDIGSRSSAACLLGALFLLSTAPPGARADVGTDPERAIMGRTTYPAGSWTVEVESEYDARNLRDETQDSLSKSVMVEHGFSADWFLAAGASSHERRRGETAADIVIIEIHRRLIHKPLELALFGRYDGSVRGRPDHLSGGLELAKNIGRWGARFFYQAESAKEPGRPRQGVHHINVGPYYRFGLQGMVGVMLHQESLGVSEVRLSLASALNESLFLGVEPKFGLSRSASDFGLDLSLSLYFGEFGLGEWLLD